MSFDIIICIGIGYGIGYQTKQDKMFSSLYLEHAISNPEEQSTVRVTATVEAAAATIIKTKIKSNYAHISITRHVT